MRSGATTVVLRWAILAGVADFRAAYTWPAWIFGWLVRMICQVTVFALLGKMIGSDDAAQFLLLGTAVLAGAGSVSFAIQSVVWEQQTGTLPALAASRANPYVVFFGRSLHWVADGTVVFFLSFVLVSSLFSTHYSLAQMLATLGLGALTFAGFYFFCLALAALVLHAPAARNLVSNLAVSLTALFCGLQVPLSFWPEWLRAASSILPFTNGVAAIRALLMASPETAALSMMQGLVTVCWALLSVVLFSMFFRGARKGGFELSS